ADVEHARLPDGSRRRRDSSCAERSDVAPHHRRVQPGIDRPALRHDDGGSGECDGERDAELRYHAGHNDAFFEIELSTVATYPLFQRLAINGTTRYHMAMVT